MGLHTHLLTSARIAQLAVMVQTQGTQVQSHVQNVQEVGTAIPQASLQGSNAVYVRTVDTVIRQATRQQVSAEYALSIPMLTTEAMSYQTVDVFRGISMQTAHCTTPTFRVQHVPQVSTVAYHR